MYWSWTICVEWAVDHFGLFEINRSTFDEDIRENRKTFFYIFVPSDLDLWPLDLKFALPVTLVQRYVST